MVSKRLARQWKKAFGDTVEATDLGSHRASVDVFLGIIDDMYTDLDDKVDLAYRTLEVSSRELTDANAQLIETNQVVNGILNSLGQGVFFVDRNRLIGKIYSRISRDLLGEDPSGKKLEDVLRIAPEKRKSFFDWFDLLFEPVLDFEDLSVLGPRTFQGESRKTLKLEFREIKDNAGKRIFVVVVLTDITLEEEALRNARREKANGVFVSNILRNRFRFSLFVKEFRERSEEAQKLLREKPSDEKTWDKMKQILHALKGGCAIFGFDQTAELLHGLETEEVLFHSGLVSTESLESNFVKVILSFEDRILENQDLLQQFLEPTGIHRSFADQELRNYHALLQASGSGVADDFENRFLRESFISILKEFNGDVEYLARRLGKKVYPILFSGIDVRVDRQQLTPFLSEFVHVFRNIVDHGIEVPDERRRVGKDESGEIQIELSHDPRGICLVIRDDGAGIDEEKLRDRLLVRGLSPSSREELLAGVFLSDVSTSGSLSEISGRGVGLYSFQKVVSAFGGTTQIDSDPGKGVTLTIYLPDALFSKRKL